MVIVVASTVGLHPASVVARRDLVFGSSSSAPVYVDKLSV